MSEWLSQFHFLRPWWLAGLPLVAGVVFWIQRGFGRDSTQPAQIASHLVGPLTIESAKSRGPSPLQLILAIWCTAMFALAGPTCQRQPSPFADDESSLIIVLRVSESMLNADLAPTRLERARAKISALAKMRGNAATGLIAYNGTAHLVMPLTDDAAIIDHMLQALDPDVMPKEGDALPDAIALAEDQFHQTNQSGSILVITDSCAPVPSRRRDGPLAPIQIWAVIGDPADLESSGIASAGRDWSIPVQTLTADDRDLSVVISRCRQSIVAASVGDATAWRDDGYWFIPLLVVGCLSWSRRGWSVPL
ncbi:MAG: VWA domain-containing protein [Planctomycetota bacterium]